MAIGEFGTIINQAQVASFAHIHPPIKTFDVWAFSLDIVIQEGASGRSSAAVMMLGGEI